MVTVPVAVAVKRMLRVYTAKHKMFAYIVTVDPIIIVHLEYFLNTCGAPRYQHNATMTRRVVSAAGINEVAMQCRKIWWSGSARSSHQTVSDCTLYVNDFQTLNNGGS